MDVKEATKRHLESEETRELQSHLLKEDVLGVIIRGHTYVEAKLTSLIELALKKPNFLKLEKRTYALKCDLAVAMGIVRSDMLPALRGLGRLRNRLAHNVEAEMTREDCTSLYGALPKDHQVFTGPMEPPTNLIRATIISLYAAFSGIVDAHRDTKNREK